MTDEGIDDATIPDDSLLLRRIPIQPNTYIVWDSNQGRWIISSQAFKNHRENPLAMSAHLKLVLDELGLPVDSILQDPKLFSLAAVPVGVARGLDQKIIRMPLKDDPAHAHVHGKKSGSTQKKLANAAVWVIPPPGVA